MLVGTTDHKGHRWVLLLNSFYRTSRQGLTEIWAFAYDTQPEALREYTSIPLPVFTEWWDDTEE